MNDDASIMSIPVPEAELADLYRNTVSMQGKQVIAARRAERRHRTGEAVLLVLCLALGAVDLLKTSQFVPVFVFLNPETGMNDTATALSDLPPSTHVAGIEATLWQYLLQREHYSSSEADQSYAIVSAMSDDQVRLQYQKWSNPKLNKESPAYKLGKTGSIRIHRRGGSSWIAHDADYSAGVYQVPFCRVVTIEGQGTLAQAMMATLTYQTVNRLPLLQRVTSNPFGIVVTAYPGSEPQSPVRMIQQPGGENPCG